MKVAVLGGKGMLGHKMVQVLREHYEGVVCTIRGELEDPYRENPLFAPDRTLTGVDVSNRTDLKQRLMRLAPDVIVNCVGVIKQRRQAQDPIPTISINSLLPHELAEWAAAWGGRLVHFSTDCVFSGKRGGYSEDDPSDAEDLYGKTKFLGEVRRTNALTLRTSIIGRELAEFQSLLEWFLSQRGKRIRGFTRVIYSGVTTNFLADLVARLIAERPDLYGLYQVASVPIPKHDLLCLLRDAFDYNVEIEPDEGEVSDRSLVGEKFVRATGIVTPAWPELVAQLRADRTPYEQWRKSQ